MRLWNCYPSTASLGPDAGPDRLREWIEIVEPFDADVVGKACLAFRRTDSAFPPSVGQIYAECNKHASAAYSERYRDAPRLSAPKQTEAQRDDMKRRFTELVAELQSGKNFNPEFGKLQAGNKLRDPYHFTRKRTTPGSWLEKWERENSRPYYGLKEAAE